MRPVGAEDRGAGQHEKNHDTCRHHVFPYRHGNERHPVPLHVGLVAGAVRLAIDQPSWHRPLVDAESQHEPDVQSGERDEHPRDHEHVEREEPRERSAGDDRPAQHHVHERVADKGCARGDRRPDSEPPVGILVPP